MLGVNVHWKDDLIISTLDRSVGTKLILGGLRAKRAKMGVRGLSPEKIFQDHALFIAGNALSVQFIN